MALRLPLLISSVFALTLVLPGCGSGNGSEMDGENHSAAGLDSAESLAAVSSTPRLNPNEFLEVEWIELMPKDDLEALLNPPDYLAEIEDGGAEDQLGDKLRSTPSSDTEDRYQQALVSTRIVEEMDGQAIRIPGFIVPLEFSSEQVTTQFFLVPFFGACLHLPPPPPNQIVFVDAPEGIKLESLYQPYWISGMLQVSLTENDVAKAAYAMTMQYAEIYSE